MKYFQLPIDGGDSVYRERVYCYELYHQMRVAWSAESAYTLNGEVDKSAHPILSKSGTRDKIPDLLVHGPGNNTLNHAIIEVKSETVNRTGSKNDLEKISNFMKPEACYDRGIFMIFGHNAAMCVRKAKAAGDGLCLKNVEIWIHTEPMCEAHCVHTFL